MAESHNLQASHLHSIVRRLFISAGTPLHIAQDVAEILVNANLAGHDSHGVLRIPGYLQGIESGGLNPTAEPLIIKETDTTLIVEWRKLPRSFRCTAGDEVDDCQGEEGESLRPNPRQYGPYWTIGRICGGCGSRGVHWDCHDWRRLWTGGCGRPIWRCQGRVSVQIPSPWVFRRVMIHRSSLITRRA